jgi:phage terminase large subunit-like protein
MCGVSMKDKWELSWCQAESLNQKERGQTTFKHKQFNLFIPRLFGKKSKSAQFKKSYETMLEIMIIHGHDWVH